MFRLLPAIGAQNYAKTSKASVAGAFRRVFANAAGSIITGKSMLRAHAKEVCGIPKGDRGDVPPYPPLGPAQRVPAAKPYKKKEARRFFVLLSYTGNSDVLCTPCFPFDYTSFALRLRGMLGVAPQTLPGDDPRTPFRFAPT